MGKVCLGCGADKPENEESFYIKRIGTTKIQFWPRCKPCHNRYTWKDRSTLLPRKPPYKGTADFKLCIDCGPLQGSKPVSEFYVHSRRDSSIRYFPRCKKCHYKYVYEKDKRQGYKWHGNKQKNGKARQLVRAALTNGRLTKPSICQLCEKPTDKYNLHGHHYKGYDYPLDVRWLCRSCHKFEEGLDNHMLRS